MGYLCHPKHHTRRIFSLQKTSRVPHPLKKTTPKRRHFQFPFQTTKGCLYEALASLVTSAKVEERLGPHLLVFFGAWKGGDILVVPHFSAIFGSGLEMVRKSPFPK